MRNKLMSCVALVAAMFVANGAYAEQVTFSRGDVDQDGYLTARDLLLMRNWLHGLGSVRVIEALDVDRSGTVDTSDMLRLFMMVQIHMAPSREVVKFERGDLDDNGRIDQQDLDLLSKYLTAGVPFRGLLDSADLNRDGRIDAQDLQDLRAQIQPPSPPAPQPTP